MLGYPDKVSKATRTSFLLKPWNKYRTKQNVHVAKCFGELFKYRNFLHTYRYSFVK